MAKQPHCHRDGPRVEARETRGQRHAYGGARPRVPAPRAAAAATLVALALAVVAAAVGTTPAAVVSADGPSAGRLAEPGARLPNHTGAPHDEATEIISAKNLSLSADLTNDEANNYDVATKNANHGAAAVGFVNDEASNYDIAIKTANHRGPTGTFAHLLGVNTS